jgi:hypothetical protein
MKCCIMLNYKYSLNCCTCLIWFEFELKTLEKINRKGIRNSLKIEKTHFSPVDPAGPASCPRALGVSQAGPACRRQPARSLSPSCCPVDQSCRHLFSRLRARSLCSAEPTCQPVPNLPPTSLAMDAPTTARSPATSARPRPF